MRDAIALYVCPDSGCPKIGMRAGQRCEEHDKDLVRTVYRRDGVKPPESHAGKIKKAQEEYSSKTGSVPLGPEDFFSDLFGKK